MKTRLNWTKSKARMKWRRFRISCSSVLFCPVFLFFLSITQFLVLPFCYSTTAQHKHIRHCIIIPIKKKKKKEKEPAAAAIILLWFFVYCMLLFLYSLYSLLCNNTNKLPEPPFFINNTFYSVVLFDPLPRSLFHQPVKGLFIIRKRSIFPTIETELKRTVVVICENHTSAFLYKESIKYFR